MRFAIFTKSILSNQNNSMVLRLAISLIIASIMISATSTLVLIYSNYAEDDQQQLSHLEDIKTNNLPALADALWYFDQMQINTQGDWISSKDTVDYVKIATRNDTLFEKGSISQAQQNNQVVIPVTYNNQQIGRLEIGFTPKDSLNITQSIEQVILLQLLPGLILILLLVCAVHLFITRHLTELSQQLKNKLKSGQQQRLILDKTPIYEELTAVVESINLLSAMSENELSLKDKARNELSQTNQQLKQLVNNRSQSLQTAINELKSTIEQLDCARSQLIESEKLSTLGSLVAGVAHEVKTPVGLCITTHSFIKDLFQDLQQRFEAGTISQENFAEYIENMEECIDILSKNLQRTATLVESFKHISEDQAGEILRHFNLAEYFTEILSTLTPKLKTNHHLVEIYCPDDIHLNSYPGALSQVIINLIMNSLLHGFEGLEQGTITLSAENTGANVTITYRDDGIGLSKEAEENIFVPFYSSKQGCGGTGLGMHLAQTLVEQTLQGTIQLQPSIRGCSFVITIPHTIRVN